MSKKTFILSIYMGKCQLTGAQHLQLKAFKTGITTINNNNNPPGIKRKLQLFAYRR